MTAVFHIEATPAEKDKIEAAFAKGDILQAGWLMLLTAYAMRDDDPALVVQLEVMRNCFLNGVGYALHIMEMTCDERPDAVVHVVRNLQDKLGDTHKGPRTYKRHPGTAH